MIDVLRVRTPHARSASTYRKTMVCVSTGQAIAASDSCRRYNVMNAKDVLIGTIEQAGWVTATLLVDLSDADLLIRPVPGMNHVAWQLGHLVVSVHEKLATLGHAVPALPAGFAAAHSTKVAANDPPVGFSRKADYLALMAAMREATIAAIRAMPDADLDTPAPEPLRKYTPTIGAVYRLIGTHEFMHHGQIVALRRRLGKPVLI